MNLRKRMGRDVHLHNFDIVKDTVNSGRGAIVVTAHFGNPEMGVQVGAILGLDILILAEPLQPPAFAETMHHLRTFFTPNYVDVSRNAVAGAMRHLRKGGVLAITCDRDIQRNGTPVLFFGAPTRMPLGAVELAQRTGAALIPGYCQRTDKGFDVYFEPPIDLCDTGRPKADAVANTKALLSRVESWIASDPGQWMVLERIWKPLPIERVETEAPVLAGRYNDGASDG
jgi:KDO2-lipid IV(A) lauroyltransferase